MCGIAGTLRFDSHRASEALLQEFNHALAHRGPDDRGVYVDGPCGFAHRRLSILDLSTAAHQPMCAPDGSGVLCYNGEIYNYQTLRKELEDDGVQFHSTGDTEVLLHACRQWGVAEAARRANGMFAFAYWDVRRQEMWLARDRLGIKPLYYHKNADRLIFASEIKALLRDTVARPDPVAIVSLLASTPVYDPLTPFEDIRAVEGGQIVRISSDASIQFIRYFTLSQAVDHHLYAEQLKLSTSDHVTRLDNILNHSVLLHLASDAKVAAMASGGLDSSIIAHLTRQHLPQVTGYHADVVGILSERQWAEQLAIHSQIPLRVASLTAADFVRSLAEVTYANECPLTLHPNTIPFFLVCQTAQADGIKVLLTGEGADELFAGYQFFASSRRRRSFEKWCGRISRTLSWVGLDRVGRALVRYTSSDDLGGVRSNRAGFLTLGHSARVEQEGEDAYAFITDAQERESQVDLYCYLHGYLQSILWRNDRMGMATSLESRVPFIENDLISYAINLPMRYKLRAGKNKWMLRQVAKRYLPTNLSLRPKFGFPIDRSMYPKPDATFFEGGFLAETLSVRSDELAAIWKKGLASPFHWLLVEVWGQLYFQNRSSDEIAQQLTRAEA